MFESFKTRAEAVSAEVYRFGTKAEALNFIVEQLKKEGISEAPGKYAVWADCPFLKGVDKAPLTSQFPGLKFEFDRKLAKEAHIGITQMDWGIANTGTLAGDQTAVEQRLASSLSWIHIAIVATDKILADLPSLMTKMHPNQAGFLSLITGPSRTADIERVLTIGVHGPERLVIVSVDELGGLN
ncbi:MAG TPA: lactate utilization protein [Dissulfurispiraceae bacterium]|nr:lactate utilization protein [Dissulfurispiraceae bacterium]